MTTSSVRVLSRRRAWTRAKCDDNHEPCRTLQYALGQVDPGDAIKLASGTYDLAGVDIERLALGKEGVRGGYSAEDHFRIQNSESNPTRVSGVPDDMRNNFIAHGFIVMDANGNSLPRIEMAKLLAPTACANSRAGTSPATTSISCPRCSSGTFPRSRPAPATCGASSISTTIANTR